MTNRKLKAAMVLKYGSQIETSKALKIPEPRLSRLVNGHVEPTAAEVKLLRERLGVELEAGEEIGAR